jgi:Icc-related predicted phosphoesterase
MLKIALFSDTHGEHRKLKFDDDTDIAIFAGDAGTYRDPYRNELPVLDFIDWYASLKVKHKVWIAGNHDTSIESGIVNARELSGQKGLLYLQNDIIIVEGLKIFGSPCTPTFGYGWAFNVDRGKRLEILWDNIPIDTDIIVTHGPAFGILDMTETRLNVGCKDIANRIQTIKPKLHVSGHIHEAYGHVLKDETHYVNASVLDLSYKLTNDIIYLNVDEDKNFKIIENEK